MDKVILVTGGAGYIGSHTCKALKAAGFLPVVYDNLSTGHAYAVKWGPFVKGDLNEQSLLRKVFEEYRPQAVLHFAADALVIESMQNPAKYYRNNVGSSLCLLEAMRDAGVKKLVFSSSCATYGHPQFSPLTEEHPQMPINPYGRTKWMVEQMIQDFGKAHGLDCVALRYFNAAGADLEGEIGENHAVETHLIPSLILTAMGQRKEFVVYGTDFPSQDGSAVRDYIHVKDLADAHVAALSLKNEGFTAINLGTGRGASVLEIVGEIERFCGKKIPLRIQPKREGEPGVLTADNHKAQKLLHWTPGLSDLPTLIRSAWQWHEALCSLSR